MSDNHVTLKIPKKALIAVVLLLIPAAFVAGVALGGNSSDKSAASVTSTSLITTTSAASTTVPATVVAKKTTATTVATKKKKSAATTFAPTTTTVPPKLAVSISYSDNCPEPGVNNRVIGEITISWQSTAANKVWLKVFHGADKLYEDFVAELTGQMKFSNRTCNNVKLANGSFSGQPLVVTYQTSAYDASGNPASANGQGQF